MLPSLVFSQDQWFWVTFRWWPHTPFLRARQEILEKLEQDRRERMSRSLQSSPASVSPSTSTETGRWKDKLKPSKGQRTMMVWWEGWCVTFSSQTYVKGQMEEVLPLDPTRGKWLSIVSTFACLLFVPNIHGCFQAVPCAGQTSRRWKHHLLTHCYRHCCCSPKDDCRSESHCLVLF